MLDVRFVPVAEDDLEQLLEWFADEELSRRYGGKEWPKKLWEILQQDVQRQCWMVWQGNEVIGYIDWEKHPEENHAWIGLVVKPNRRGEGLGTYILGTFLSTDDARAYADIRAGIEPDNIASVRCFSSAGFVPVTGNPDEEGIVDYVFRRS